MSIKCDNCNSKNKQRYKTFFYETPTGKELVTWCYDCLGNPAPSGNYMSENKAFEHISIPFWKHMGMKPKPHEIALEKEMKRRGMSWGDLRRSRDYKRANNPSAMQDVRKAWKQEGGNYAPEYKKSS